MTVSTNLDVTREVLREFLPDHETIIKFEDLLRSVESLSDGGIDNLQIDVGTALARANAAFADANSNLTKTFLSLLDVNIAAFTVNRIPYESASAIVDSANLTFDGNNLKVSGTTDATSGTTGAINTLGGIGITKSLWVALDATIKGSLAVSKGLKLSINPTPKTANYTFTSTDYTILFDTSAGGFTATLPTAIGKQGQIFNIKKVAPGTLQLATTLSQTINGTAPKSLSKSQTNLMVQSDNANWITL